MTDIDKKKQAILLFILIITLVTAFVFLQFLKPSDEVAFSPSTPPATSIPSPDSTVAANAQKTTGTSTRPTVTQQKHKPKVPKGLVILLKEGASIQPNGPLAKYLAMPEVSHKRLHNLNMISITIPDSWDLNKIQKELKQDEAVLDWLQNEPMVAYGVIPNDPLFNNASFGGLDWALGDAPGISARSAWHYTTGDETVIIAVFDTGIDYTHPDLKDNIWINQAELNGQPLVDDDHPDGPTPCIPTDLYCDDIRGTANLGGNVNTNTQDVGYFSHGTAVSSIIAGRGDNQEYYAGVSWRAKILSVTVFNRGGFSDRFGFFAGAEYILEMKLNRNVNIRAINFSGGSGNSSRLVRFGEILAKRLEAANILLVTASGNSSQLINDQSSNFVANVESPIHITVGATNRKGESAGFSNLGPQVEIVAPGEAVPGLLSLLTYASRNIEPILLANFPKNISDPNAFEKWLVAPKGGWRITNNGQLMKLYSGLQTEILSLSPRYGSVSFETSLSSPEPLTLNPDFNPEDVQIAVFLAYSLREGAALTLEVAATTQTRSWTTVQTWTGTAPFERHELNLPQGFDERSFFIRFRTTPSVRGDDFAVVEYLSVVHIPPIPNYANRRGNSVTDYVSPINGTSFSSPHVAGVAALAWAQRPDLSAVEMKKVILDPQNIDPFPCTIQEQACTSSGGSLNAFKVLSAITTPAVSLSGANDIITTPGQTYHFPVRLHRAPGVFTSIDQVIFRVELTHRDTASEQTTFQTDTLSFTADNWYQTSSITLTTEANGQALFVPDSDGFIITSMRLIASDTTKSDTDFAGVSTEKTVCFQKPNGQAQVLGLCNFIAQEGGSLTYHLRLSSAPADTFTITVVLASDSSASASKTQFTFTSANWNERQILTIHFNNVDLNSNTPDIVPIRFVLTDAALSTSQTLNANINLLDSGQVPSIVPSVNHLELIGHSSQALTMKLGGQPSTIVQLDMDNGHPGLFDVYPKTLVFTPDNWDDAQIITLKATSIGQTNAMLRAEVNNTLSDTQYHNTSINISILFDARDLRLLGLEDRTLFEGESYTYLLTLSTTPRDNINIRPQISIELGVFEMTELIFNEHNWSMPQPLTFIAATDFLSQTNRQTSIVFDEQQFIAPSSANITIINSPSATAMISTSPAELHITNEPGKSFEVRINGTPPTELELLIVSRNPAIAQVSPTTIVFNQTNWHQAQTISVVGPANKIGTTTIDIHPNLMQADTLFHDRSAEVSVLVERPAIDLIGFEDRQGIEGEDIVFHVSLSAKPSEPALIDWYPSDLRTILEPKNLRFTPDNWHIPQKIIARPAINYGTDIQSVIALIAIERSGIVNAKTHFLTTIDNKENTLPQFIVSPRTGERALVQPGIPLIVDIKLDKRPYGDNALNLFFDTASENEFLITPSRITFTRGNWNTTQTFVVTYLPPVLTEQFLNADSALVFLRADIKSGDIRSDRTIRLLRIFSPTIINIISLSPPIVREGETYRYFVARSDKHLALLSTLIPISDDEKLVFQPEQISLFPDSVEAFSVRVPHNLTKNTDRTIKINLRPQQPHLSSSSIDLTILDDGEKYKLLVTPEKFLLFDRKTSQPNVYIRLPSRPQRATVLRLSTSHSDFSVTPNRLLFAPENWNTTQSIRLNLSTNTATAVGQLNIMLENDLFLPENPALAHTLSLHPLQLNGLDDIRLSKGNTHTYQLRLTATPDNTVSLVPLTNLPNVLGHATEPLIFTAQNWNKPQALEIHALNISDTPSQQISLSLNDLSGQLLSTAQATVSVVDNAQRADFVTSFKSQLSLNTRSEGSVHLTGQPQSTVVLTVTITTGMPMNMADATLSFTELIFTVDDWNIHQEIPFTSFPLVPSTLTLAVDNAQSDNQFHDLIQITALHPLRVLGLSDVDLLEEETHTYKLKLSSTPDTTLVLTPQADRPNTIVLIPNQIIFTQDNWNTTQDLYLRALVQADLFAGERSTIAITADHVLKQLIHVPSAELYIHGQKPQLVLTPATSLRFVNNNSTQSISVRLSEPPLPGKRIVVELASEQPVFTVLPSTLSFNISNWDNQQTAEIAIPSRLPAMTTTLTASVSNELSDDGRFHDVHQSVALHLLPTQFILSTRDLLFDKRTLSQTLGIRLSEQVQMGAEIIAQFTNNPLQFVLSGAPLDSSLTFDSNNWNTTQYITVTALPNTSIDTTIVLSISNLGIGNPADNRFQGLKQSIALRALQLLGLDNQTIVEGEMHTYHLRLSTTPANIFTVRPNTTLQNEFAFVPEQITFTPNNWSLIQTLSITPYINFRSSQNRTVVLDLTDTPSLLLSTPRATIRVIDNEAMPGIVVTSNTDLLFADRVFDQNFSFHLNTPLQNENFHVFIGLATDSANFTLSSSSFFFDNDDWDRPRTVTVNLPFFSLSMAGILTVSVNETTRTDPTFRGISRSFALRPLQLLGFNDQTILEGKSHTYSLRLSTTPRKTFRLVPDENIRRVTGLNPQGRFAFMPTEIVFSPSNWNTTQTLTIEAKNNLVINLSSEPILVSLDDTPEHLLKNVIEAITVIDNGQTAGLIIQPDTNLLFANRSTQQSIAVRLNNAPLSSTPVVINLSTNNPAFSLSTPTLNFDSLDWDVPKHATITVLPNTASAATLFVTVDSTHSDSLFQGLNRAIDLHPLQLLGLNPQAIVEGESDTYSLSLSSTPLSTLTLTPSMASQNALDFRPSQIIFTPDGWNIPQSLMISTPLDLEMTRDYRVPIVLEDMPPQLLSTATEAITVLDNGQFLGFTLDPNTALLFAERDPEKILRVHLNYQPQVGIPVVVSLASNNPAFMLSTPSLSFDANNWDTFQRVTITMASENRQDGTLNLSSSSASQTIDLRFVVPGLVVSPNINAQVLVFSDPIFIAHVSLNTKPSADGVVVDVQKDGSIFLPSPRPLNFNASNWNTPQEIRIFLSFPDDGAPDDGALTLKVNDDRSDMSFHGIIRTINLYPLRLLGLTSPLHLVEGESHTFSISLSSTPPSVVHLGLQRTAPLDRLSVNPSRVFFTPDDWRTPKNVTITALFMPFHQPSRVFRFPLTDFSNLAFIPNIEIILSNIELIKLDAQALSFVGRNFSQNLGVRISVQPDPGHRVIVSLATDESNFTLSQAELFFNRDNWNTTQYITVTASPTAMPTALTLSINDFQLGASQLAVALNPFQLLGLGKQSIVRGESHTYLLNLSSPPTNAFTLTPTIPDMALQDTLTFSPETITFGPDNWDVLQMLRVSADRGPEDTPDLSIPIRLEDAPAYLLSIPTAVVTLIDQQQAPVFNLIPSRRLLFNNRELIQNLDIRLNRTQQLSSRVRVNLAVDNTQFTLSTTTLTFDLSNLDTTQSITVTADPTASKTAALSLTVDDAESDNAYHGESRTISLQPLQLLGFDSQTLMQASSYTYSLRLSTRPIEMVTLRPNTSPRNTVSFAPSSITFTPDNWAFVQRLIVSAPANFIKDQSREVMIVLEDTPQHLLSTPTAIIQVIDDKKVPAIIVSSLDNLYVNPLPQNLETLRVQLNVRPNAQVDIDIIIYPEGKDFFHNTNRLSFDSSNWDIPQRLTYAFTPSFEITESAIIFLANPTQLDPLFAGVSNRFELHFLQILGLSAEDLIAGETYTYPLRLSAEPPETLALRFSTSDNRLGVSPAVLVFTQDDWDAVQTLTVSANLSFQTNSQENEKRTVILTLNDAPRLLLSSRSTSITISNDDLLPGLILEPDTDFLFAHRSFVQNLGVRLRNEPQSKVVLNLALSEREGNQGDRQGENSINLLGAEPGFTVSTSVLTFDPHNWDSLQSITITALSDTTVSSVLSLTVDAGSDSRYLEVDAEISLHPLQLLGLTPQSITEGDTHTYSLRLSAAPEDTLTLIPSAIGLDFNLARITFTPNNWNTIQTLTATTQIDLLSDEDRNVVVTLDDMDELLSPARANIRIIDNGQTAGLVIEPDTDILFANRSNIQKLSIRLSGEPQSEVILLIAVNHALSANGLGFGFLPQSPLIFNPSNWDSPQDFDIAVGPLTTVSSVLSLTVGVGSDSQFHGISAEVALRPLQLLGLSSQSIAEGASHAYALRLSTTPESALTLTPDATSNISFTFVPPTIIFTPENWNSLQTLTATARIDLLNNQGCNIVVTLDDMGKLLSSASANICVIDNGQTAGLVIEPNTNLLFANRTLEQSLAIRLRGQPQSEVVLDLVLNKQGGNQGGSQGEGPTNSLGDDLDFTLSKSTLTFDPNNWDTPQSTTITAASDTTISAVLSLTVNAGSNSQFRGISAEVALHALQLLGLTPQSIAEGSKYTYYLRLSSTPTSTLTLTPDAPSSMSFTFAPPTIAFTRDNWSEPQELMVSIKESVQSGEHRTLALDDENLLLSKPSVMITIVNGGLRFRLRMFLEGPLQ